MVVVQRPSPLHGMPTIFKWRSSTASGIHLESSLTETNLLERSTVSLAMVTMIRSSGDVPLAEIIVAWRLYIFRRRRMVSIFSPSNPSTLAEELFQPGPSFSRAVQIWV